VSRIAAAWACDGDYRQLLVSKQLLEAMLTTAAAAMAGTDLLLVTPLAVWGYHLAQPTRRRPAGLVSD